MPRQYYFLFTIVVLPLSLLAQSGPANSQKTTASRADADSHWLSLQALAKPNPVNAVSSGDRGSSADQRAQIAAQADQSRQAAQSAKDFYRHIQGSIRIGV